MASCVRFLLIVPPFLLFGLISNAQLQGKIDLLSDEVTYEVSLISSVNWAPPQSTTPSAQITLRAATGTLVPANVQNLTGAWELSATIISPPEAPGYDYFSFRLIAPLTNTNYQDGVELLLFSFGNAEPCVPVTIVNDVDDPFLPPNSLSVNIGNQFTVLAAGLGVNAYSGNAQPLAECDPPDPVFMSALANDDIVPCPGETTSITVEAIGGTQPYNVTWENTLTNDSGSGLITEFEGNSVFNDLLPGEYLITMTDSNDLTVDTLIFIDEPDPIEFDLDPADASCEGSQDGQITIRNLTGGTVASDYIIQWSVVVVQADLTATELNPGTYSVTILDDNGCSATASTEVGATFLLEPNPDVAHITCNGEENGVVNLYAIGSNPPFEFNWSGNGYTGNESSAWGLSAGTYYFTITDFTGVCFYSDSIEVLEPEAIEMEYSLTEPTCEQPNEATITIDKVSNAVNGYQFSTDGIHFFQDNQFLLIPGTFQDIIVEDGNGCQLIEEVFVTGYDVPQIQMESLMQIELGDDVRLKPIIFPEENLKLSWSPAETLSCDDCPSPLARPIETTTYRLMAEDTLGCRTEGKTTITVKKNRKVFIPTAFSPNDDGQNDYFTIYTGPGVGNVKSFRVFDRWGDMVFEAADDFVPNVPMMGWDGSFRGPIMKEGVFIYVALVEFDDGLEEHISGEVILVK